MPLTKFIFLTTIGFQFCFSKHEITLTLAAIYYERLFITRENVCGGKASGGYFPTVVIARSTGSVVYEIFLLSKRQGYNAHKNIAIAPRPSNRSQVGRHVLRAAFYVPVRGANKCKKQKKIEKITLKNKQINVLTRWIFFPASGTVKTRTADCGARFKD